MNREGSRSITPRILSVVLDGDGQLDNPAKGPPVGPSVGYDAVKSVLLLPGIELITSSL
jgi:hypothetical protein